MKTKDNEATTIQNNNEDSTQIVDNSAKADVNTNDNNEITSSLVSKDMNNRHNTIKKVAGIAGTGVLLGTASTVFMAMKSADVPDIAEDVEDESQEGISVILPEVVVEGFMANQDITVNDDMTFDEAFSAAREALGAGSVFEWHGNAYATYTKEEWDAMSDDEKSDFYDTLHIPNPYNATEESEVQGSEETIEAISETVEPSDEETNNNEEISSSQTKPEETIASQVIENINENKVDNDIEIVSVGNPLNGEGDIEILGITQDPETGYNVGAINVDGQEVFVIDVDGDMVFDAMAVDTNNNGVIDEDELIDIHQSGLSVNDLGGLSDSNIDPLSNGDSPDYLSEMISGS